MLKIPFLTDLDSRAAVKGSRDPLGVQQIWTRMGRHVVGNLTTVSNSVRDFSTLLLGYYFAERLCDDLGPDSELSTFLKWEQLAAYSRGVVNKDFAFRGSGRVKRNLNDGGKVLLSDQRSYQILANQKIYGLWGLYTMPARASGLVDGNPTRLTPPALEFVEKHYLPLLAKHGGGTDVRRIVGMLKAKSTRLKLEPATDPAVMAVGRVLGQRIRAAEREFFYSYLVEGGPADATMGRQRQLASLFEEAIVGKTFSLSPAAVSDLIKRSIAQGEAWHSLAFYLDRIHTTESVLAPSSILFDYLLGSDGRTIASVAGSVLDQWGDGFANMPLEKINSMHSEWSGGDIAIGDRWVAIGTAFSQCDFGEVIERLVEQNASVMSSRGGAAWVEKHRGKLKVRFIDENGWLPTRDNLHGLWRFPYFLESLHSVAASLKQESAGA